MIKNFRFCNVLYTVQYIQYHKRSIVSGLVSYFNQIKNILFKDLKHLTDLQLHGGHWTSSEMDKLIQAVGGRLHNLGKINGK